MSIPDPTLPRYGPITPRPFDILIEPREFGSGGGVNNEGAFFTRYAIESGGADDGDIYLLGGSVTGGFSGSHTFPDYKVWDAIDGAEEVPGTILYVQVAIEAIVEDGVMLPGTMVVTGSAWGVGTSLPPNDALTVSSPTGNVYHEIGRWTATEFLPSTPGNLSTGTCIGDHGIRRV